MLQDYEDDRDLRAKAADSELEAAPDVDAAGFYEDLDSPATDMETDRTPRFGEEPDDLIGL